MEETPANTFRAVGDQLICKQERPAADYRACLRIGPIRVGESYPSLRERYPKPWKEYFLEGGGSAAVFQIIATRDVAAYWIIGHRDGKIVSVQLTGNYSHPDFSFATIRLNDTEEKVIAVLGRSRSIRPVTDIGGILWDYRPIPVSLEFVQGRVHSMKVAEE